MNGLQENNSVNALSFEGPLSGRNLEKILLTDGFILQAGNFLKIVHTFSTKVENKIDLSSIGQ